MNKQRWFFAGILSVLSFFSMTSIPAEAGTYNTVIAVVPVSCRYVEELDFNTYEITIEPENQAPVPQPDTMQISENETKNFYIEIDEPGTYYYKVYERPGANDGIDYDATIYHLTVYVEKKTEVELVYAVTVTSDDTGHKPDTMYFQNAVLADNDITTTTTHPETTTTSTTETSRSSDTFTSSVSSTAAQTTATKTTTKVTNHSSSNWVQEMLTPLTKDGTSIGLLAALGGITGILSSVLLISKKHDGEEAEEEENEK